MLGEPTLAHLNGLQPANEAKRVTQYASLKTNGEEDGAAGRSGRRGRRGRGGGGAARGRERGGEGGGGGGQEERGGNTVVRGVSGCSATLSHSGDCSTNSSLRSEQRAGIAQFRSDRSIPG